jgi:hypothetical protein
MSPLQVPPDDGLSLTEGPHSRISFRSRYDSQLTPDYGRVDTLPLSMKEKEDILKPLLKGGLTAPLNWYNVAAQSIELADSKSRSHLFPRRAVLMEYI